MYSFVKVSSTRLQFVSRCLFTDGAKCNINRELKFMNKLIEKGQSKRGPQELFTNSCKEPKTELSVHTLRRMAVLNKVFMEYVTDIMSTGEIKPEILQRDVEISHVKVTPDFKQLNVYWIDHGSYAEHSDTEELLTECAFQLRHELSKLRVIGRVPPIQFVKCKGVHIIKETERMLKQLDLDENYKSSPYPDAMHHTVSAAATVDVHAGTENDRDGENAKDFSVSLPVMRHDVFGLDHYRIMTKIKTLLNKPKRAVKRPVSDSRVKVDAENISNYLTEEERKEQFAKFLKHRRKEKKLKLKNLRSRESQMYDFIENGNDNKDYDIDGNYYDDGNDKDVDDDFDTHCDEELNKKRS